MNKNFGFSFICISCHSCQWIVFSHLLCTKGHPSGFSLSQTKKKMGHPSGPSMECNPAPIWAPDQRISYSKDTWFERCIFDFTIPTDHNILSKAQIMIYHMTTPIDNVQNPNQSPAYLYVHLMVNNICLCHVITFSSQYTIDWITNTKY